MRIIRFKREDGKLIAIMANMYDEVGNPIDYKEVEHTEIYQNWSQGLLELNTDQLLDLRNTIEKLKKKRNADKEEHRAKVYDDEIKAIDYLLYKATNPK